MFFVTYTSAGKWSHAFIGVTLATITRHNRILHNQLHLPPCPPVPHPCLLTLSPRVWDSPWEGRDVVGSDVDISVKKEQGHYFYLDVLSGLCGVGSLRV